jgi:hypothetical protein
MLSKIGEGLALQTMTSLIVNNGVPTRASVAIAA